MACNDKKKNIVKLCGDTIIYMRARVYVYIKYLKLKKKNMQIPIKRSQISFSCNFLKRKTFFMYRTHTIHKRKKMPLYKERKFSYIYT